MKTLDKIKIEVLCFGRLLPDITAWLNEHCLYPQIGSHLCIDGENDLAILKERFAKSFKNDNLNETAILKQRYGGSFEDDNFNDKVSVLIDDEIVQPTLNRVVLIAVFSLVLPSYSFLNDKKPNETDPR